jgi:hypothetical protein
LLANLYITQPTTNAALFFFFANSRTTTAYLDQSVLLSNAAWVEPQNKQDNQEGIVIVASEKVPFAPSFFAFPSVSWNPRCPPRTFPFDSALIN